MRLKLCGPKKERISAVGQGFGLRGTVNRNTDNERMFSEALRYGIELAMTFIDTAEVYGEGYFEEIVGKTVKGIRGEVFLATKFSPENSSAENIKKALDNSLRRMGTDYIDLYQFHWPNPLVPLDETALALQDLVQSGKVRYIGVSNFGYRDTQSIISILGADKLFSAQIEYNLFDRSAEKEAFDLCEHSNMMILAYSPLDQGRFCPIKREFLQKIADKYNKTIVQVVLNWLISHDPVIAIPRSFTKEHIKENAVAADFIMSDQDIEAINYEFTTTVELVDIERIILNPMYGKNIYISVKEALENVHGFFPSPSELAVSVRAQQYIKPVRLKLLDKGQGKYVLDEGVIRFWAWVIAFDKSLPIPALIRED